MNRVRDDADIELLTIKEVAQRQRVSPRTVRRQIEHGDLPYHRIGRAIRVSVEDLRAFLKRARRRRARASPPDTISHCAAKGLVNTWIYTSRQFR
jgi:excisionase family DNA binding protein